MVYQLSPFLLKNRDGFYSNLLTGKSVRLSSLVHERLKSLLPGFTPEDVARLLGIDLATAEEFCRTLANKKIALSADLDPFRLYLIRYADVEICSHCNARCCFCPVSIDPRPKKTMALGDFEIIVQKLAVEPNLRWVSLNHYNEPLLDPTFLAKVEILACHGVQLRLFTNGHLLTADVAKRLVELKNVESIVLNIPSGDPCEYREMMGVKMPAHLIDRCSSAVQAGLPIYLCINGNPARALKNSVGLKAIMDRHGARRPSAFINLTHDRAGMLTGSEVHRSGRWMGKLGGCRRMFEHLHISVNGDVFLCCQDYYQRHVFGNLISQSISAIMSGDSAVHIRRQVFGGAESSSEFICRGCVELVRVGDRLSSTSYSDAHTSAERSNNEGE